MTDTGYIYEATDGVAIKHWTRGVQLEESAHQQLRNIASLPFIHKHVAVMPDVHWGMGATIGSVIPTKGAIIPAAVGVDIGCFVGDTKVPLLDGTQETLIALTARDEEFWVYSLNDRGGIVPGKARALKTRSNAELMRVVVSGGDEIVCTPDHEFMLNDGTYRQARDLKFNDSLMPLYRRWSTRDGYESASTGKGTSRLTHVLVWEAMNGPVPGGHVVHHRNRIHFANNPENFQLMTVSEHSAHHRMGRQFNNADPEFQKKRLAGVAARSADPAARKKMSEVGTANIKTYMADRPEHFAAVAAENGKRGASTLRTFNTTPRECNDCDVVAKNPAALRWHKSREHAYNHKVVSISTLDYQADVYCLQVEEHHNFALAAGVFVHNCGMMAVKTTLNARDLPDNLAGVRSAIEAAVPHGRTDNGGLNDRGAWGDPPQTVSNTLVYPSPLGLSGRLSDIVEKNSDLQPRRGSDLEDRAARHLGTLGTGNHFIEVCLDESDDVWIMLHSGSRGVGNRIGTYFIQRARREMERWFIQLPDKDLAYVVEGSELFDDYVEAVGWAQDYALANREYMMSSVIYAVRSVLPYFELVDSAVNCHHNYVARENHFGSNVLVTRKGAVRARKGDLGIIPGSMGERSFIVRGKGNPDSFHSCSHGAGRAMSRGAAKRQFTVEDHAKATIGVECRKDDSVLDETPGAYKDIDAVMAAQADLVDIVHTLKQVVCVKG